jgi:hypothetical protein
MTQTELDLLCCMAQYAITELVNDLVDMRKRAEIDIKRRFAQILGLNSLMRSIQDYDLANWDNLTDADIQVIKEKIVALADWR